MNANIFAGSDKNIHLSPVRTMLKRCVNVLTSSLVGLLLLLLLPLEALAEDVIATVIVGNSPYAVAVTPDGYSAYVTNYADNTVSVFNSALIVTTTVLVGRAPRGVAITPDGDFAYVANNHDNSVSVIEIATKNVVTVPVGKGPQKIAITPDGRFAYVTNYLDNSVSVIEIATKNVVTVPVGKHPYGIAVSPSGDKVYVVNYDDASFSTITVSTNAVRNTAVGAIHPRDIVITPDGKFAYIAVEGGSVFAIGLGTAFRKEIPVGNFPVAVAVSPNGRFVYAANSMSNNISVIETATNTVSATTPVGGGPGGIAFHPITGCAVYVTNGGGDTVSVIEGIPGCGS